MLNIISRNSIKNIKNNYKIPVKNYWTAEDLVKNETGEKNENQCCKTPFYQNNLHNLSREISILKETILIQTKKIEKLEKVIQDNISNK